MRQLEKCLLYSTSLVAFDFLSFPFTRSLKVYFIYFTSLSFLYHNINVSFIYHSIRAQSSIKLYVIYNVLEVVDKLASAFGLEVLESKGLMYTFIALIYNITHTLVLFVMLMTLNVTANSNSNSALFALLISNQFIEIKSNVFKRHTIPNIFQLICNDSIERLQLFTFVVLMTIRNFLETRSFHVFESAYIIIASEVAIDWIKHYFILKFNRIDYTVYDSIKRSLKRDVFKKNVSSAVQRIGFVGLPLSSLAGLVALQSLVDDRMGNKFLISCCVVYVVLLVAAGIAILEKKDAGELSKEDVEMDNYDRFTIIKR